MHYERPKNGGKNTVLIKTYTSVAKQDYNYGIHNDMFYICMYCDDFIISFPCRVSQIVHLTIVDVNLN